MAFVIDGTLGVDLSRVDDKAAFKLGLVVTADDGHDYIYVQASAGIAASTQVTITDPAMTAAAGAGGWYTVAGQAPTTGQYFWARRGVL